MTHGINATHLVSVGCADIFGDGLGVFSLRFQFDDLLEIETCKIQFLVTLCDLVIKINEPL